MKYLNQTIKVSFIFFNLIAMSMCKTDRTLEMPASEYDYKIIFLHHSTGGQVWKGNSSLRNFFSKKINVPKWFMEYNETHGTKYYIQETVFPKAKPYGWNNYPYDYYNIWVKNAGEEPFKEEPTLEMLSKDYDMVIFKHCFPVSNILEDIGSPNINSPKKRIENYKLQYDALKNKMHEFPNTKFIVWTGAALVKNKTSKENAERAKLFFEWVRNEWDLEGDNIFLWDLQQLQTEGGLYFKDELARSSSDSHLGKNFARKTTKLFSQRIIDIIETNGQRTTLTGELRN